MAFRGLQFNPLTSSDEPMFFELNEKPKLVQLGLKDRAEFWEFVMGKCGNCSAVLP